MINVSSLDWQKSGDGLLPVIIQDARTGQVLMLGYMNEQALLETIDARCVTFYSRSKGHLWQKGKTSGNVLRFVSVTSDCDRDALLIRAIPQGPTCHTGKRSCFDAEETSLETLGHLIETIRERSEIGTSASYTKQLLEGGIEKYGMKVLEEAEELMRAAKTEGRQRTVEEAADLLYHFLVFLEGEGVTMEEIAFELRKRRKGKHLC